MLMPGNIATMEQVAAIPLPKETRSYRPVPNLQLVEMFMDEIAKTYRVEKDSLSLSLGLGKNDQQMFGSITVDAIRNENFSSSLTTVFRNSYDKSLSIVGAGGANCWICDNLQVGGQIIEMRKHTTGIYDDLSNLIRKVVQGSIHTFNESMDFAAKLQEKSISLDDSFRTVGLAMGHNVLKPQQATVTLRELQNSSHEEFKEENVWSLYNHFTEALKRGPAGGVITRHDNATNFFNEQFLQAA